MNSLRNGMTQQNATKQSGPTADLRLLLRANEAASALSISPRMLWAMTDRGEIPCLRIGRSVRYDPRDLVAWIDRHKIKSAVVNNAEMIREEA